MLATTLVIVSDITVVVGSVAMIVVSSGCPRLAHGLSFFPG